MTNTAPESGKNKYADDNRDEFDVYLFHFSFSRFFFFFLSTFEKFAIFTRKSLFTNGRGKEREGERERGGEELREFFHGSRPTDLALIFPRPFRPFLGPDRSSLALGLPPPPDFYDSARGKISAFFQPLRACAHFRVICSVFSFSSRFLHPPDSLKFGGDGMSEFPVTYNAYQVRLPSTMCSIPFPFHQRGIYIYG